MACACRRLRRICDRAGRLLPRNPAADNPHGDVDTGSATGSRRSAEAQTAGEDDARGASGSSFHAQTGSFSSSSRERQILEDAALAHRLSQELNEEEATTSREQFHTPIGIDRSCISDESGVDCPICMEWGEAFEIGSCGHKVCVNCAARYIRSALGNAAEQIGAQGIRCPLHSGGGSLNGKCSTWISPDTARALSVEHYAGGLHSFESCSELLQNEELDRFDRFTVEASFPFTRKVHCPKCGRLSLLGSFVGADQEQGECPYCNHTWNHMVHTGSDSATFKLLEATSKPCPGCGLRITHYHGHDCHHISPGLGCPRCSQHFCYVCLRKHGEPGRRQWHPDCTHRQSFCKFSEIRKYLKMQPYPHDTRCGCPICPDCRLGKPCPQCPGTCVVCKGKLQPGGVNPKSGSSWSSSSL